VRLSARTVKIGEGIAAFAVLLEFVVALQVLAGAYTSGFGGYPDEPAHLVTSLMVRDFFAGLDFRHPWQFAQQFYFHYPEVAIGVWPPGFYVALAMWFLIFGTSRGSALMFIAIVATATASVMYFVGKRLIGRWAGALAAALFVASPLVQEASARVMTEHLSTLGMLLATLSFARFASTKQTRDAFAFGAIAAAVILTHGNAWALGLVPGFTIVLTDRWYLLRRPAFWAAAFPVVLTCVPWYVFVESTFNFWQPNASLRLQALPEFAWSIYLGVGLPVLILAVIGVWTTIIEIKPRIEMAPEWGALAGLVIAIFLLYWVVPIGIESRYVVPVIPAVLLFSAAGANLIAHRFTHRLPMNTAPVGLALVLMIAFSVNCFALPLHLRNEGYEALLRDVKARVGNVPQVWLISSGSTGEGCLVAAVALQEARPNSYVLRAKTILAGGDWVWRNQQDRFDTPAKLAGVLDEIPVTIIVVDDRVPPDQQRPYHDRLRKLIGGESDTWELIGSYPQTQDGIGYANSLHVYARRPVASLSLAAPVIRLDRLKALMVRKELR
jgi:hypothetical protein